MALAALALSKIVLLTVIAAAWLLATQRTPIDFASFWAAGSLVAAGQPLLAYDIAAHRAVEMSVASMGGLMPFPYPPPFLFFVAPFGFQPFWLAYVAWMAATAGLYLLASRRFLSPRFAFAQPAALVTAAIGQNGFLTASMLLFGIGMLATSPFAAGAIFGLLVIKPQLALLVPLALLAAREWRAIGGAALSAGALLALAVLVFGPESYRAFIAMTGEYAGYMSADRWNWAELASVYGFFRFFGLPQLLAGGAQLVAALAAAVLTWRAWSRGDSNRGAVLAAGTLLVPPYVFTYDSLVLALPLAVLLRDSNRPLRVALVWLALFVPLLGYVGVYPGPNTVPIAAAMCLWWMSAGAEGKKKAAAPEGTAAPVETRLKA